MTTVLWLPAARADVAALYTALAARSPEAAGRAATAIGSVARQLEAGGEPGFAMEDGERRQAYLRFVAGTYVVRYRRDSEGRVVILRVWHSSERRETRRPPSPVKRGSAASADAANIARLSRALSPAHERLNAEMDTATGDGLADR